MNNKNNILLVDLNHLIYRYGYSYFSGYSTLEKAYLNIINMLNIIKKHYSITYVTIVGDLSCPARKEYFQELFNNPEEKDDYKSGRSRDKTWEEFNDYVTENLSKEYPLIKQYNYEADDIITAMVQKLDNKFHKYILTIDADLLALIDENTSVLMFRNKEIVDISSVEKYYLFDYNNFNRQIKYISSFKAPGITLNNFLLVKMLIGDKSDNIPRVDKFTDVNIKDFLKWTPIDKNFKWSYFLSEEKVEEELKKIILNNNVVQDALRNFKIMKMNSDLGNRRTPFKVKKEYFIEVGDHTIN